MVELIAAMAIAGLVMLSAILLFDVVRDTRDRLMRDAESLTTKATETQRLRQLLADAAPTDDSTRRFVGSARAVTLWSRCLRARGWMAQCHATLALVETDGDDELRVSSGDTGERTLRRYRGPVHFEYFDADDAAWRGAWDANATIPAAIAVVARADTMVYPVGASRD